MRNLISNNLMMCKYFLKITKHIIIFITEFRLRVTENNGLKRMLGFDREEVESGSRELVNKEIPVLH
jgi:hypothetical protein